RRTRQRFIGISEAVDDQRRGGVHDDVATAGRLVKAASVEKVCLEQPERAGSAFSQSMQVGNTFVVVRIAHGAMYGVALFKQQLDDPAGDIAGGAGDEHGGRLLHHWSPLSNDRARPAS